MGSELPFESLSFCKHITAPLDAVQSGGGVKSGRLSTVLGLLCPSIINISSTQQS